MDQPKKLKHYQLLDRLGEGGMGVVYRARDTRLGRTVALKVLPRNLALNEDRARRFEREARIASSLSHPCIAHIYDFDREDETTFLTMELVEGATIRKLLDDGPVPMQQVLDCGVQVAEALEAAHKAGVIHRDLKPENVMAADSGYFKVLDFGVARFNDSADDPQANASRTPTQTWATTAGELIGTVAYMSPEQALGQQLDARSDIFSLGTLLYEMVTGRQAFQGTNPIAVAHKLTNEEPERASASRPQVSQGLEAVIQRCMAKRPEDRYANASELVQDMRALRSDTGSGAATRLHALQVPSRNRIPRGVTVALGVGALIAVGWFWSRDAQEVRPELGSPSIGVVRPPRPPLDPGRGGRGIAEARSVVDTSRPRVIVAFFEANPADEQTAWLAEALPEMLTTDLSRAEGLDVIATQRLYDLLATAGTDEPPTLDRSTTAELARWAGADLVISGSVFRLGDRYRLDAQAYDTETGSVAAAQKVEGEDLFRMVDELTASLLDDLSMAGAKASAPRASRPSSKQAYRHFLRGQEMYEDLRFADASVEFRDALEIDPRYSQARLRLAMSLHQTGDREEAMELVDESAGEVDALPEAERLLTLGLRAYLGDRDPETGEKYMSQLIEQFPNENGVHVWWARAASEVEDDPMGAMRKLRDVMEKNPNYLPAIADMAAQLADLGSSDDAAQLLRDAIRRNPRAEQALGPLIDGYTEIQIEAQTEE